MNAATPTASSALKHTTALASLLFEQGDLLTRVEARMASALVARVLAPLEALHGGHRE